jgi:hypothetical protein
MYIVLGQLCTFQKVVGSVRVGSPAGCCRGLRVGLETVVTAARCHWRAQARRGHHRRTWMRSTMWVVVHLGHRHDGAPPPIVDGFVAARVETSRRRHVVGATPP